jgi:branched-chain amino acid transport system permease protein
MFLLQILINGLISGTEVLLLATGLFLIFTVARVYHIALAGIMISSAYVFYVASAVFPALIALIFAVLFSVLLGILSFLIMEKLIKKQQTLLALLVSISIWILLKSALAIIFGSEGKFLFEGIIPTYQFYGLMITQVGLWIILLGFLIAVIAFFVLHYLPFGRQIRAIAQHQECASLVGIKKQKLQIMVFAFSAVITALVGILLGMYNGVNPASGADLVIEAFMALLVGGVHDFRGTIAASYLLILIPQVIVVMNFNGYNFSASWQMVFLFVVALFLLIVRPQGLFVNKLRQI